MKAHTKRLFQRGIVLCLSAALLCPGPAAHALAPSSIFQEGEVFEDDVIASEIRTLLSRIIPHAPVLIWDAGALRKIPRELFAPGRAGAVHFVAQDSEALESALGKNGLARYPMPHNYILHGGDGAFVPGILRENIAAIIRNADAEDFQGAAAALQKAYASYPGRIMPAGLENINAELVISVTGMEDLTAFFHDGIVLPLAKKFGMSRKAVEARLAKEGHAAAWQKICEKLIAEHVLMLYRACHPHGLVYFCAPFAHWNRSVPAALTPSGLIDGYRLAALAWQRGLSLPRFAPPAFVTELWQRRQDKGALLEWQLPERIVLNAAGSAFPEYFRTVATNVFARMLPARSEEGTLLFQSLLLTPDTQLKTHDRGQGPAELPLLPAAKQPSLQETFAYVLPLLRCLPTVEQRLDLIVSVLQREHPGVSEPLTNLFRTLRTRRDTDMIKTLVRRLVHEKAIQKEEGRELMGCLMVDKANAGPSAQEAVDLVYASEEEPGQQGPGKPAPENEEIMQSGTVKALSAMIAEIAAQAQNDQQIQYALKEAMGKDERTRDIPAEGMFVLDQCVYLTLPVADQEIPLRFYREERKPFNVLRDLSTAEWIASLRNPAKGLRVQAERRGQIRDALTWDFAETKQTAELARALEREDSDAVGALKALHKRLLRPEFFALLHRLDLSALYRQVRAQKDLEALRILREYRTLAEKLLALESVVRHDGNTPDALARALLDKSEGEDGHYLDTVVCMAQFLQDKALGRPHGAQHLRDTLAVILEGMPDDRVSEFDAMEEVESARVLEQMPEGSQPQDPVQARQLLRALRVQIAKAQEALHAWKNRTWWETLFDTVDDFAAEGRALDERLEHLTARRDDLTGALAQGIVRRIPSGEAGALVYLLKLGDLKMDYVLNRVADVPDADIAAFLALTVLPLQSPKDAHRMDRIFKALQGLKPRGVDVFRGAPFYKRKGLIQDLYERVKTRLTGLPYYDNGHLQGLMFEQNREETAVFWDKEIAFEMILEAVKAKYGEDVMLIAESADTARREDTVLDKNPERCSGHALQIVFRRHVSLPQARDAMEDMQRTLGAGGMALELYHPQDFVAAGLGGLPDQSSRAALLTGASAIDQCIASMENRIHHQNADAESKDLMRQRAMATAAAAASPREAAGYALMQRLLMQEAGEVHMPQRLAHYVLRVAFADMLFKTRGKVLEEMQEMLRGNRPRGFSYAVQALASRHLADNAKAIDLIGKAYANEAKLFVVEYSPAMQDFIDEARAYVEQSAAGLAQHADWEMQEDKDFLRAMIELAALFRGQGVRWYRRGQKVLEQDAHAKFVFFVLSGAAQMVCKDKTGRRVRRTYKAGSLITEKCVFPGVTADAAIVAAQDSDLLLMAANKTQFWFLLDERQRLKNEVLALLYESELANLIKAREAAAGGTDPSGAMLATLLSRRDQMINVFRSMGIAEEQIAAYQKSLKDAGSVQKEAQYREMDESVAAARRKGQTFVGTLTPLASELEKIPTVAGRVDHVMTALREAFDMPAGDTTLRMLAALKESPNERDRASILALLTRAGVLPRSIEALLKQEPMPAPPIQRPRIDAAADRDAWEQALRKALAEQGAPLPAGKDIYFTDEEGRLRPLKEVHVPELLGMNPVGDNALQNAMLLKALAETGVLQGNYRSAAVIQAGGGTVAAALANIPGLQDLYYTDISPYALAAAQWHVAKNGPTQGLREHAVLGSGLKTLRGPPETNGKFDLLLVYPYGLAAADAQTTEHTVYRGSGLLREVMECAADKWNKANPEAQLILILPEGWEDFEALAKFAGEFGGKYFLEPFGREGRLYRLRAKSSQLEKQEMGEERAILRERLRNLDIARGRTLTDEELDEALEQVFGRHFTGSQEYRDFTADFSGLGDITVQIWHAYLPSELSLAENIRLLAGMLRCLRGEEGAGRQKVLSLDLRRLIAQLQDKTYREEFFAQWDKQAPEEGLALLRTAGDPHTRIVSTVLKPAPAVMPAAEVVPVAEIPAVPPVAAGVKRAFAPLPAAVPGEQFFARFLALPEEALERASSYNLYKPEYRLQTLDEAWVSKRTPMLSEWKDTQPFLQEMTGKFQAAGLQLKIALQEEDNPVFRIPMADEHKTVFEFQTLLQRNIDKELEAVVIPAGVFRLAPEGTFVPSLKSVLQHHLDRKAIADRLKNIMSVEDLAHKGVRVSEGKWKVWADQFALFGAALNERDGGVLPPRMIEVLQSASNADLQAIVADTDKAVKEIRENRLFDLVNGEGLPMPRPLGGGYAAMIVNQRKLITEHAMSLLTARGVPLQAKAGAGISLEKYERCLDEAQAICESERPGMISIFEKKGIPFAFVAPLIATARNHYQMLDAKAQEVRVQHLVLNVLHQAFGVHAWDAETREALTALTRLCDEDSQDLQAATLLEALAAIKAYRDALGYHWMRPEGVNFPPNPLPGTMGLDIASGPDFASLMDGLEANGFYAAVDSSPFVAAYLNEYAKCKGITNVHILRKDVLALGRPKEALGLIRMRNAWSYVKQLGDKIGEMRHWLAPGGQIVLECDPDAQSHDEMLATMGGIVDGLVAEGWKQDRQPYRIVLTKPSPERGKPGFSRRQFMAMAAGIGAGLAGRKSSRAAEPQPLPKEAKTLLQAKEMLVGAAIPYYQAVHAIKDPHPDKLRHLYDEMFAPVWPQLVVLLKDESELVKPLAAKLSGNKPAGLSREDMQRLSEDFLPAYFLKHNLYFQMPLVMATFGKDRLMMFEMQLYELAQQPRMVQLEYGEIHPRAMEYILDKPMVPSFMEWRSGLEPFEPMAAHAAVSQKNRITHYLSVLRGAANQVWMQRSVYKHMHDTIMKSAPGKLVAEGQGEHLLLQALSMALLYKEFEEHFEAGNKEKFIAEYLQRSLLSQRMHELMHVHDKNQIADPAWMDAATKAVLHEMRAASKQWAYGPNAFAVLSAIIDMYLSQTADYGIAAKALLGYCDDLLTSKELQGWPDHLKDLKDFIAERQKELLTGTPEEQRDQRLLALLKMKRERMKQMAEIIDDIVEQATAQMLAMKSMPAEPSTTFTAPAPAAAPGPAPAVPPQSAPVSPVSPTTSSAIPLIGGAVNYGNYGDTSRNPNSEQEISMLSPDFEEMTPDKAQAIDINRSLTEIVKESL